MGIILEGEAGPEVRLYVSYLSLPRSVGTSSFVYIYSAFKSHFILALVKILDTN